MSNPEGPIVGPNDPGSAYQDLLARVANLEAVAARVAVLEDAPGGGAVESVNTQTGAVVLDASDVGADPAGTAAGLIDNTAYDASTWNGDTTHAPSKDALRDKIESLSGASGPNFVAPLFEQQLGLTSIGYSDDGLRWGGAVQAMQASNGFNGTLSNSIAIADCDGDTVVVATVVNTLGVTLLRSDDFGLTWRLVDTFPVTRASAVYFDGTQWVVGTWGRTHAIYTSPDLVTWTARTTPLDGATAFVSWIVGDGTALVAGLSAAAVGEVIMRSTDNGATWSAITSPLDHDVSAGSTYAAFATADLIVATGYTTTDGFAGIITSDDHGATWTLQSTAHDADAGAFVGVTFDGTHWWACGFVSGESNLYRSTDATATTWVAHSDFGTITGAGAGSFQPWCVTWDGSKLYVGIDGNAGIWITSDINAAPGDAVWAEATIPGAIDTADGSVQSGTCCVVSRHAPTRVPARA